MKVVSIAVSVLCLIEGCSAFTNKPFSVTNSQINFALSDSKPFFAEDSAATEDNLEEEMFQEEMRKTRVISNLRNENGVDYAPWMNISEDDEKKIRQLVKEKAEARRKRQLQEQTVKGSLLMDSQAQELSGTGLRSKVIGDSVELEWATSSEANTQGFIVKRRPAKTDDFVEVASFRDWGPLASKGPDGGVYRFLDDNVPGPGGWVYRVTECEKNGRESDICQCLVEMQTAEEQRGAVIAAVAIGVVGVAAVAAGILLDPVQGGMY